jgi:hypothetical protein
VRWPLRRLSLRSHFLKLALLPMPISQFVSERQGIIVWWKNADGDAALPVVLIVILVRRYTVLTGLGAASVIGQAIPTLGAIDSPLPAQGICLRSPRRRLRNDDHGLAIPF